VRLVWSLLAVLLATALVPLFITAYALIDINQETLESATREYQLQVAGSLASRLDGSVSAARGLVGAAVAAIGPRIQAKADTESEAEAVRALLRPYLTSGVVLLRYTSPKGSLVQVGDSKGLDDKAIQDGCFEAFALAMEGGGALTLPIRIAAGAPGQGPRPGAVVAAPVGHEGGAAGVVSAVVDLTETWTRGVNDVGEDYAVFALDPNGGILASANLSPRLSDGTYRKLDIVQRFLTTRGGIKEAKPLSVPGGSPGKRELLGASVPTDLGWGLFVLVDRSLAYHAASEMKSEVYRWALFAIALAAIAAVVAAGLVTRPLAALVEGARSLARGEFGKPVSVRSRSEIGELAETFNFMSEEIRNHIQRIHAAAEENQQLFLGTIRALAAAIDEKDPYTRGHSERVHRYSVAVARHMGLAKTDLRDVTVAALLHDIGKIGIEDAILRKPAALTDKEFEIMKRHPEKGSHIMEPIPQMKGILGGIRNHHERWSGGGYPDNLKGEQIPLIARIVQVADTFDAMTTTRPYQRAMKMEAGVARIRELSGIVFDPKVVEAFQEAWVAGDLKGDVHPPGKTTEAPQETGA
jgi:HD-GYP domain-containing protein (c-di-GMP phosphodiesterase class II)